MDLDRRAFLKRMGTLLVATSLGPIALDSFGPLGSPASAMSLPATGPLPTGTPILVVIDLQGGNDSLNTLVPVSDSWYYDPTYGHGSLAIAPNAALPLPGLGFGLHPSLSWLANRWATTGDVALVPGAGERVKSEFSHFAASMYRNTADFSGAEPLGWLGRYNDSVAPGSPVAAVSTNGLHAALTGALTPVLVVVDASNFSFSSDWRWRTGFNPALQALSVAPGATGGAASAAAGIANALVTGTTVRNSYNAGIASGSGSGSALTHQLAQAAMLIQAGVPSQTYVASVTGFDTHGSESWTHGDLLSKLDGALAKFFAVIDAGARKNDVFVLVTSEFGRQVTANSSGGCDHGQAGLNILVGGGVVRGLYGGAPNLNPGGPTRPNRLNDAMIPTVDFRAVYATVLNRLGGDANLTSAVLRGTFTDLGVFWGQVPPPIVAPPPVTTTTPTRI
ncbi:MAG: hypothetical protein QOG64_24 [Acidimicrobiaceae bacterium]|nr:hypothetical protein [Acidimicrobiaceae bacterium]